MAGTTELFDGLDGAIGCDLRASTKQLFVVEFDGKVSRFDLVRDHAGTVSEGEATIHGTFQFDLDSGTESETDVDHEPHMDVWWRQRTETERELVPRNGARLANLGVVSFSRLSSAEVQQPTLSTDPIDGSDGDTNQLVEGDIFVVETTEGNIAKVEVLEHGDDLRIRWKTYELSPAYQVLGTGYDQPEDIVLGSGDLAYVTERGGNFLIVDLEDADRSSATVLVSGLNAPHQISLDRARNQAFVVEFGAPGRLLRIDLSTGSTTTLFEGLDRAVGLAMTEDGQTAYVTEQASDGHRLTRIDLVNARRERMIDGLDAPFFLEWVDENQDQLLLVERDPADRLRVVDVDDASSTILAEDLAFRPSSTARLDDATVLVCSDDVISTVDIADGLFSPEGPLLLGVGRIPISYIEQDGSSGAYGYATTVGAGIALEVEHAPFGGRLPIKLNHERAFEEGARYYRLLVETPTGEEIKPRQAFTDHRWNTSTDRFERETISPRGAGYYAIRLPSDLWFDHWLGYVLDTGILGDGEHVVRVKFYTDQTLGSELPSLESEMALRIDNGWPVANIREIIHHLEHGSTEVVDACAIVDQRTARFDFAVTAQDPQGHFRSLSLVAVWGDNESREIASIRYDPASKGIGWTGPGDVTLPSDSWEAEHRECAHMFRLRVLDRVTNGRHHPHRSTDRKLITLMIPE